MPPYTPEFAPIELLFRSIKAKLKIHREKQWLSLKSQNGIELVSVALRKIKQKEIWKYWSALFEQEKTVFILYATIDNKFYKLVLRLCFNWLNIITMYSQYYFFDNSASILFSLLLTIWSLILLVFFYFVVCSIKLKTYIKNTISSYFFNNSLLFVIQGFLELLFGCTLNVISFESSTVTEIISYMFSVLWLIGLIFVMWIASAILYDKRKYLIVKISHILRE